MNLGPPPRIAPVRQKKKGGKTRNQMTKKRKNLAELVVYACFICLLASLPPRTFRHLVSLNHIHPTLAEPASIPHPPRRLLIANEKRKNGEGKSRTSSIQLKGGWASHAAQARRGKIKRKKKNSYRTQKKNTLIIKQDILSLILTTTPLLLTLLE
ncbi:hypothetical protein B0T24DRAFT_151093 [Lasiosphaeria ovina]|uniref:Uncharacterized protein n=1 Tax=Lasiosphaeria ovina TaxID=92902 RepID=A0AAE0KMC9_9PEZI|nr:hypothetical protein B0T24DRAFT_151093 [Lasiosphaeria ovina]